MVTDSVITELRMACRLEVAHSIGDFQRKMQIRTYVSQRRPPLRVGPGSPNTPCRGVATLHDGFRLMEKTQFTEAELGILYRRFHAARFYTTQALKRAAQRASKAQGAARGAQQQQPTATPTGQLDFLLFYNFLVRLTRCAGRLGKAALCP